MKRADRACRDKLHHDTCWLRLVSIIWLNWKLSALSLLHPNLLVFGRSKFCSHALTAYRSVVKHKC